MSMAQTIFVSKLISREGSDFEVVERKGIGHPDTLADHLAEELSRAYSEYTRNHYGAILHHNFDKTSLHGGQSFVKFGEGYLTNPVRVILSGRASIKFGEEEIPVRQILEEITKKFLAKRLRNLNPEKDLTFVYNIATGKSPGLTDQNLPAGARKFWHQPRNLDDLPEIKNPFSNDTSLGVGYGPNSKLERLVLTIEKTLNSDDYKEKYLWLGSDIKIMGTRNKTDYDITLCVPQISTEVPNLETYKKNKEIVLKEIGGIATKILTTEGKFTINLNTRDNDEKLDYYLTATGSSIESGDEGVVGRGNRINGLITPCRPMSMEGACGKNPVYFIGKVYYFCAQQIADRIFRETGFPSEVYMVSQSGRPLLDPWKVFIAVTGDFNSEQIAEIAKAEIANIPEIKNRLLRREEVLS